MNYKALGLLLIPILLASCGSSNKDNTIVDDIESVSGVNTSDMFTTRDKEIGYDEATAININLSNKSSSSNLVSINDNTFKITGEGVFILTGSISNGNVIIEANDSDKIQIVLNNVTINSSNTAPIYVKSADKVFITLATNSINTLTNNSSFVQFDENNIDGVIFSKSDLTLNGNGTLYVNSIDHGIVCKDDLVFTSGTYDIESVSHSINGKDSIRILNANIKTTSSSKDSLHSENLDDSAKGFIYIEGGTFNLNSYDDGISASSLIQIQNGNYTITSTNKGIVASDIILNNGEFNINSNDDSIHSNNAAQINSGKYTISSNDDAIHSTETLVINSGTIEIKKSYEGLESNKIEINGGDINIYSSDDGINAAGGMDSSGFGGPGFNNSFQTSNTDCYIKITSGNIYVNSSGDGLDANGSIYITGGTTIVEGPTNDGNGPLDYDSTAEITGGTLLAIGSSGMAQNMNSGTQGSILYCTSSTKNTITLKDSSGNTLFTYTPTKSYSSVVISTPDLVKGNKYTLTTSSTVTIELSTLQYSNGIGGGNRPGGRF